VEDFDDEVYGNQPLVLKDDMWLSKHLVRRIEEPSLLRSQGRK
jgi:hypothetical protein